MIHVKYLYLELNTFVNRSWVTKCNLKMIIIFLTFILMGNIRFMARLAGC